MSLPYTAAALLLIVGVLPPALEVATRRFDFFNAKNPFIAYYLLQLGVSGIVTVATGRPSEVGLDPERYAAYYTAAFLVAGAGIAAFHLGYYTQRNAALSVPQIFTALWRPPRPQAVAAGFVTAGFIAFALLIHGAGGLSTFLATREQFRTEGLVGQGMLLFPSTSLMTLGALVFLVWALTSARGSSRTVLAAIAGISVSLLPAFVLGFRAFIGLPVLQAMVCWNYGYRKIPSRRLTAGLLGLAIVFTGYGIVRYIPPGVSVSSAFPAAVDIARADPELLYGIVSRSKGTEIVAAEIQRLHETGGYDLGWRAVLETATILVPHSVWPGKPAPSGERFSTFFFGERLSYARGEVRDTWGGVSPTVAGELYWHFGILGVIVGLFVLGRITRVVYVTLRVYQDAPAVVLVYAQLFTTITMFAEALQGYFNGLVMYFVVVSLTVWLLTVRAPRAATSLTLQEGAAHGR